MSKSVLYTACSVKKCLLDSRSVLSEVGQIFEHGLSEALGCELDDFEYKEDNKMRMYGFGGEMDPDDVSVRGSLMSEDERFSPSVPESAGS